MSILMRPFIHLGYGFEFGIPGQIAEGERVGFSMVKSYASILNRGRPGIHRRPPCRPDGGCATFVLYQGYDVWHPLWADIQALTYSRPWREAAYVRFFPSAP